MNYVELIAALALLQMIFFTIMTGKARVKSGLKAPAVTGDENFERMYRVQVNTLEVIIAFLPALFLAANHWSGELVSGLGVVYLIGRLIYWRAYVSNPAKRGLGFILSILPTLILIILAIIGSVSEIITT